MPTVSVTTVLDARVVANEWLSEHLPDRFAAGIPAHDERLAVWRVPVWLSYAQLAPLGPVGELLLNEATGQVQAHTPVAEMRARAWQLYELHREQIEAPLL